MNAHQKIIDSDQFLETTLDPTPNNNNFKAKPCGEIDVDALYNDVTKRYPKVIACLAE